MYAVPAYPNKVTVKTTNGKNVVIYMRGDEYRKFANTEDGYTLISDSAGWWYATLSEAGKVERTDFRLMSDEDETIELKRFKKSCPKGLVPNSDNSYQQNRAIDQYSRKSSKSTTVGERRALVILMQYKDLGFKKKADDFETLFNTLEYRQNGATGSVRDFYRFASQGQLDYISDIYGPYTSQNSMRYYGGNSINGGSDRNPLDLCIEAIKSLPSDIDFSVYDNDGDGLVDNVHIIYAGYGEEAGASADAIWAHEYPHRISLRNEVGYSFAGYSCSPELRGNNGSNITNIGVICHELGHALGAMDYYDTNYGTGGEYEGTGQWDIMASGSWNDNGRTPCNFNPYVRCNIFGWCQQETLKANEQVSMPRVELNNADQTIIYRLDTGSDGDYYLLENRQQYLFDAAIPGSGLMIYHVHPNIDRYHTTNTVNATHPQGLYPVCASYSEPNKKKYGNINSVECPFPGIKNARNFSSESSPAAVAWNGSAAKVAISHISMSADGKVTFSTGGDVPVEPNEPDSIMEKEVVYKESFETNSSNNLSFHSITGKEVWHTYKKGDFVVNADFLPKATDGERILILYTRKANSMSEAEAIGSTIKIEPGNNYYLSFDIYCEATSTLPFPYFNFLVEDEYGEYNVYTLDKATTGWKNVEIPLVFAGSQAKIILYGRIYEGGIFVDNIRLNKETVSAVIPIKNRSNPREESKIYRLDGTYIGRYGEYAKKMPSGTYILKASDGSVRKFVSRGR